MPKKLINDYIFYKIVCLDNGVDLCYVGSTANWKERLRNHRSICNNENNKSYNSNIYKTIRENGGWYNFKMIQIGTREQLNKRQAEQIEEEYRVELKANMNSKKCYLTEEQKQEQLKETNQQYRENNRDKINQQKREYYQTNKEEINERQREYYEANKDKISERNSEYRVNNKDKINQKASEYYRNNKEELKEQRRERYALNKTQNKFIMTQDFEVIPQFGLE